MNDQSLIQLIRARLAAAVATVAGQATDPLLRPAQDAKFGDYQCNVAMSLAKPLGRKPRDIAQEIVAAADLADVAEPPEIAGPGFINIRLKQAFLASHLGRIPRPAHAADRLGIPPVDAPQRVVVDYSSPNVAKQMHVGHLRSTIIGDVIARVIGFAGHEVIRQNHIGDWGRQFGMLIAWYRRHPLPTPETCDDVLARIGEDYVAANQQFNSDEAFATEARQAVGQLQRGDTEARQLWEALVRLSCDACLELYRRLGVLLDDADFRGESFYNDLLPDVVAEARAQLAAGRNPRAETRDDQGAVCIYLFAESGEPAYKNPEGEPFPLIIQKSDGAYLYATTDLAALRYRTQALGATRLIYLTDSRQKQHFEMLFAAARALGWAEAAVALEHVTFGSVLGEDRRPFGARTGGTPKLSQLLDEAEQRAYAVLAAREAAADADATTDTATFTETEKRAIARRVGVAAIKYADLSKDRSSDYVFNWDQMLAFTGNTAPYLLYAYARIRSIYRKATQRFGEPDVYAAATLQLEHATERALALRLARLDETLTAVANDLTPHLLCSYLFETAQDFSRFYEACPVLAAESDATRLSRMRLCDLTARTLNVGLDLLGIETIERM